MGCSRRSTGSQEPPLATKRLAASTMVPPDRAVTFAVTQPARLVKILRRRAAPGGFRSSSSHQVKIPSGPKKARTARKALRNQRLRAFFLACTIPCGSPRSDFTLQELPQDLGLAHKEGVQEAMKSFTNLKIYLLPWA